jgi:hypothetical protein
MGEGSCAETRVDGVGRLLHQARRVAGRARAAGRGGVRARAAGHGGLPAGAGGLWGHGYGCFARRDSYLLSDLSPSGLDNIERLRRRDRGIAVATLPAVSPIQPGASLVR